MCRGYTRAHVREPRAGRTAHGRDPGRDDRLPRARQRTAGRVRPRGRGQRRPLAQGRAARWPASTAASSPTCRSARTPARCAPTPTSRCPGWPGSSPTSSPRSTSTTSRSSRTTPAAPSPSGSSAITRSGSAGSCSPRATPSRSSRRLRSATSRWPRGRARSCGSSAGPCSFRFVQRLPTAYGWVTQRPVEPAIMRSYTDAGPHATPGVRRDLARLLRAVDTRYMYEAAEALRSFDGPGAGPLGRRRQDLPPRPRKAARRAAAAGPLRADPRQPHLHPRGPARASRHRFRAFLAEHAAGPQAVG